MKSNVYCISQAFIFIRQTEIFFASSSSRQRKPIHLLAKKDRGEKIRGIIQFGLNNEQKTTLPLPPNVVRFPVVCI